MSEEPPPRRAVLSDIEIEQRLTDSASLHENLRILEALLSEGFAVWTDGRLYRIKVFVAAIDGLKIEIFSREHPPPHFHLSGGDIDATFSILDCTRLTGQIGGREKRLIEWWHARSRRLLVETWNRTRPSDCPVGPIQE